MALEMVSRHRSGEWEQDRLRSFITRGLAWLASYQNEDGGWGDTWGSLGWRQAPMCGSGEPWPVASYVITLKLLQERPKMLFFLPPPTIVLTVSIAPTYIRSPKVVLVPEGIKTTIFGAERN